MKTVKFAGFIVAVLALSLTTSPACANNGDEPQEIANLRDQVTKLVKSPQLAEHGITLEKVRLKFVLNSDREIVVVSTGTDNAYLDSFIKSRLNYKKVKSAPNKENVFNMNIIFKAG